MDWRQLYDWQRQQSGTKEHSEINPSKYAEA
jgi:hypothetical protein